MELRGKQWTNSLAMEKTAGKRIRNLNLYNTSVDDDFLESIAKNGTLTSIHISSEFITDRGINSIASQNPVKSFMLSGVPNVTDSCMNAICNCKTIRELYLDGTSVTDDAVESIGGLPDIWSLGIGNTLITDCGIEKIASRTIDLVSFENCPITGIGFSTWNQPEKMSLYCNGSDLTDDGFAVACRSFPRMWNVDISNTNVGNLGIKCLEGQSPTMLRINKSRIDRTGIQWIINSLPVESLELDPSQMSEPEVNRLKKPRKLNVMVYEIE